MNIIHHHAINKKLYNLWNYHEIKKNYDLGKNKRKSISIIFFLNCKCVRALLSTYKINNVNLNYYFSLCHCCNKLFYLEIRY